MLSVVLYVVIPLLAGVLTRRALSQPDTTARLDALLTKLKPYSMVGLLATVVLLFGLQAGTITSQPLDIVLSRFPCSSRLTAFLRWPIWRLNGGRARHCGALCADWDF